MMRTTIFRSDRMVIAMVGALLAPTFAFSQDSTVTSRTHLVRKGDTLWSIAREYTSDPYRWKQVYELNTATVRDPHWIYPGERLVLPGAVVADATAAPAPLAIARPVSARPASAEPASEPMVQQTVELAQPALSASFDSPTVFRRVSSDRPRSIARTSLQVTQTQAREAAPTIRAGELYAAPYVESTAGPLNAGRIVGTGDVPGIPLTESERPLQSNERIFITVPPGMSTARGARYVALRRGPILEGVGQIVIPTAIVVVDRAQPGLAVEARIVARYGAVEIGNELVVMPPAPTGAQRPAAQANGARTFVLWTLGEPVLPSLQSYVVVAGGTASGMRAGDQITFYRERRATIDGVTLPESDIGIAQIVRVTAQATTALVIDQSYAAISTGTAARVSAKMP
jgi:LysM repeat protein